VLIPLDNIILRWVGRQCIVIKYNWFDWISSKITVIEEVVCSEIHVGITCNPSEWCLFIDSSSQSIKAVLLHNGNNYPSLPMAHSGHLKADYTSVKMLLNALKYEDLRSSETSKWCHSLWAFKAVSRSFLVSFASRTVWAYFICTPICNWLTASRPSGRCVCTKSERD